MPNLENEFNILLPIKNVAGKYPQRIAIAFFNTQHTALGITNQLKTLSVYRIFGPTLSGPINAVIGSINGLAANTDASLDFTANSWKETAGDSFNYAWDVTKITPAGN